MSKCRNYYYSVGNKNTAKANVVNEKVKTFRGLHTKTEAVT